MAHAAKLLAPAINKEFTQVDFNIKRLLCDLLQVLSLSMKNNLLKKIKPFESQKTFGRRYVTHPLHVGSFLLALGLQATGMIAHELREWDHISNLLWSCAKYGIYLLIIYFIQPYIFRFAALKRIPFSVLLVGQYIIYILTYFLITGYYVSQFTHVPIYIRAINNIIIGVPFTFFLIVYFCHEASHAMYYDPKLFSVWPRFITRKRSETQDAAPSVDNKTSENGGIDSDDKVLPTQTPPENPVIHYMQSKPPYTEIYYENGLRTVKSSLSQLINNMSDHETRGLRVHRSYWAAYSVCDKVVYENGNPKLVLKDGEIIRLNRKAAKDLRAYLRENARDITK